MANSCFSGGENCNLKHDFMRVFLFRTENRDFCKSLYGIVNGIWTNIHIKSEEDKDVNADLFTRPDLWYDDTGHHYFYYIRDRCGYLADFMILKQVADYDVVIVMEVTVRITSLIKLNQYHYGTEGTFIQYPCIIASDGSKVSDDKKNVNWWDPLNLDVSFLGEINSTEKDILDVDDQHIIYYDEYEDVDYQTTMIKDSINDICINDAKIVDGTECILGQIDAISDYVIDLSHL